MVAVPNFGPLELLILLFGGFMGLPPGPHDAALVRCAPADAVVYVDWAERGSGSVGGAGIDGLAADPEIRSFLSDAEQAIVAYFQEEAAASGSASARTAANTVPTLVHDALVRPGCFFLAFDRKAAQAAAEQAGAPSAAAFMVGLKGAIVINGGGRADAIEQALLKLLALLPDPPKTAGLKKVPIALPALGRPLLLHRHGKYFIAGCDAGIVDQVVAGLESKSKGLLENPRFVAAEHRVHAERVASIGWVDVHAAIAGAATALGPYGGFVETISKLVGTGDIDSVIWQTGVVKGQIRTKSFMTTGGQLSGILALAAGRGIQAKDLAHVPLDADLVAAMSVDLAAIYHEVNRIGGAITIGGGGAALRDAEKQLERRLGFSLENDLFKAFGTVWTICDAPSNGGLVGTGLVAGLEVRDMAKAKLVYDRLRKLINDNLPGTRGSFRKSATLLEERPFLDRTIYFVNTIGSDMPLAPAFCLTENHLLLALHPQAIKAHLRLLKEPGRPVAAREEPVDTPTIAYASFDMKRLVEILYPFAPYAAQMACGRLQQDGVPLTVFSLPSARAILPYVGRCEWRITRQDKGILMETNSALPLPDAGTLILGLSYLGTPGLRLSR